MKKLMKTMGMLLLIAALLSASVLAVGVGETGVEPIDTTAGYQVKFYDANDAEVEATDGVYANAVKIEVTLTSSEAGTFELFYLVKGDESTVPTQANLFAIDQTTGTGNALTQKLYPKDLEEGEYVLMRSSSTGVYETVMTFKVTASSNYILGDVNGVDGVTATDALWVLQFVAHNRDLTETQQKAADVNKIDGVTATDALWILQKVAHLRDF